MYIGPCSWAFLGVKFGLFTVTPLSITGVGSGTLWLFAAFTADIALKRRSAASTCNHHLSGRRTTPLLFPMKTPGYEKWLHPLDWAKRNPPACQVHSTARRKILGETPRFQATASWELPTTYSPWRVDNAWTKKTLFGWGFMCSDSLEARARWWSSEIVCPSEDNSLGRIRTNDSLGNSTAPCTVRKLGSPSFGIFYRELRHMIFRSGNWNIWHSVEGPRKWIQWGEQKKKLSVLYTWI